MTDQPKSQEERKGLQAKRRLAKAVQLACLRAAQEGYEQAGWAGLCQEGIWESVFDAIRDLDLETVIQKFTVTEQ